MSYTRAYYHIVIATYKRRKVLDLEMHEAIFSYLDGILQNLNCHLFAIGGYTDHIHLAIDLHPSVSLAELIKTLKIPSGKFMKKKLFLPGFEKWGVGYYAATFSYKELESKKAYIRNQIEHHSKVSFSDEIKDFLRKNNIEFNPDYI